MWSLITFLIFGYGSAESQSWANEDENNKTKKKNSVQITDSKKNVDDVTLNSTAKYAK